MKTAEQAAMSLVLLIVSGCDPLDQTGDVPGGCAVHGLQMEAETLDAGPGDPVCMRDYPD